MAEQAIILIPDVSGFTDFTTATEIDHSAHIMTELLELIVRSNETGFTLAEIEGDAVLFYRKGPPLERRQLVEQCLTMFANFHRQLMVIERDAICQCGACQSASHLTLKFIAHFGQIKEIQIAQFVKATGQDMIVAHRLLKNAVDSDEYILLSSSCSGAVGPGESTPGLSWETSSDTYHALGTIEYEFARLSEFRRTLPPPPPPPSFVVDRGDDNLEIMINAPLKTVYQALINVDRRPEWHAGVEAIQREMTSERVGMQHNCMFMGMTVVNTALACDFDEEYARYSERVEFPDLELTIIAHYDLYREGDQVTRLNVNVNWMDADLPPEKKQGMTDAEITNLDLFKSLCERERG